MKKIILQYIFYPFVVIGLLLFFFQYFYRIPENYLVWVPIFILIPTIILIVVLERLLPYKEDWNLDRDDFTTDLIQTFITLPAASGICEFLLPFLLYIPIMWFSENISASIIESNFSLFWSFTLTLLLCEFCYYWMHRISHRNSRLWNLHKVHHSAKRVYWANSGRFHFFDAILGSAAYMFPLILLGISNRLALMIFIFSGILGFLEHVNINFKAGYLNFVFNTAELHRWHHSEKEKESNHNFGKILIIWDLIFGTFYWPRDRVIKKVGIEGVNDPKGFVNQFLFPFKDE